MDPFNLQEEKTSEKRFGNHCLSIHTFWSLQKAYFFKKKFNYFDVNMSLLIEEEHEIKLEICGRRRMTYRLIIDYFSE